MTMKIKQVSTGLENLAAELKAIFDEHRDIGLWPREAEFWAVERQVWPEREKPEPWNVTLHIDSVNDCVIGSQQESPLLAMIDAVKKAEKIINEVKKEDDNDWLENLI